MASTQNLERILQLVMDKAAETVPMDAGLIFRLDDEAQMYRVAVTYNLPPQEMDYIHFAFCQGVPSWVVEHATALIVVGGLPAARCLQWRRPYDFHWRNGGR